MISVEDRTECESPMQVDAELLTFHRYPKSMWKMLRTTNCIERINEEFHRRVKTQGSLLNADLTLKIVYGMCAIRLVAVRRTGGWKQLTSSPPSHAAQTRATRRA